MSSKLFLIRYGEIALKSKPVRRELVQKLVDNIKTQFSTHNLECYIQSDYGRIYLYCDNHSKAENLLKRVFGVVSFSLCVETNSELTRLIAETKYLANEWLRSGAKFAVRTRRVGTHPYTSQSLAEKLGTAILSLDKDLKVDLDHPDVEISIEVRHDKAYIFKDSVRGPGGLPLGSQGLVLAFIENRDDIAAAWLMMKRGCKVDLAYAQGDSDDQILKAWDPKLRVHECPDISTVYSLSEKLDADGIVLGWDAEKTLDRKMKQKVPIFYPLVGLDARQKESLKGLIYSLEEHADK